MASTLLKNKVALITGSNSGIGAAAAILFSQHGCSVALTGRNEDRLRDVQKKCQAAGAKKTCWKAGSVEDSQHLKDLVAFTIKELGPIDILVNNAGAALSGDQTLANGKLDDFDKIVSLNARSVIELTKLCTPSLKETQGTIVNISSTGALRPLPQFTYYGMTKLAVIYLTQSMAVELAPFKVRCNAISPAVVKTEFSSNFGVPKEIQHAMAEQVGAMHLLNRAAEPEELAESILFLASDRSSFMTGHNMVVDGGLLCKAPTYDRKKMMEQTTKM